MKLKAKVTTFTDSKANEPIATANITLGDDEIVVNNIRVMVDEENTIHLYMPCLVNYSGAAKEVFFPVSSKARENLTKVVEMAVHDTSGASTLDTDEEQTGELTYKVRAYSVTDEETHGKVYINDEYVVEGIIVKKGKNGAELQLPRVKKSGGAEWQMVSVNKDGERKIINATEEAAKNFGTIERFGCKSLADLGSNNNELRFFKPLDHITGRAVLENLKAQEIPYSAKIMADAIQIAIRSDNALAYSEALSKAHKDIQAQQTAEITTEQTAETTTEQAKETAQ